MAKIEKVAIIGLDCAEPSLVFERWLDDLPNLRRLMQTGLYGNLRSCLPPLTVPAWSCMATSKDPGTLGVYGFRNRRDWSYEDLAIATNVSIRQPRLWDFVARASLPSIIVGVPQTFPIVHPPRGCQVTCFLTPSTRSPYTHPPELADEIHGLVGDYMLDVENFRTENKTWLLEQIYRMAEQRFKVSRHLLATRPWNLFWMVELGADRIHHGFWRFMDPEHRRHPTGNPLQNAIHDYYVFLDEQIGALLAQLDLERTAVWIVSDHGAQRLDGGFCLNDWLIREGLLTMKTPVSGPRKFDLADVDWSRTKVWGDGGYTGQCFINRAGREPRGIVSAEEYEGLRDKLIAMIEALPDHTGRPFGNRAFKPERVYSETNAVAPDLILLCGELHWRIIASIGHSELYSFDESGGPDDANHAPDGLYILSYPGVKAGRQDATLYDVTPTTLQLLRLPAARGLQGQSLLAR